MNDKQIKKLGYYAAVILALILVLWCFSSCERSYKGTTDVPEIVYAEVKTKVNLKTFSYTAIYITKVDNCEYVIVRTPDGVAVTHHAACSNHEYY